MIPGTPHYMLPITTSPSPEELHETLTATLGKDPDSYKPIAIIHALGLGTSLSWPAATASMDEWLAVADASARNVPFIWLGPNAAGHLKPPGLILGEGNNALWHYTIEMAKEARSREIDALGLYNLTLQASSWDGSNYAQRVLLVEAMMVSQLGLNFESLTKGLTKQETCYRSLIGCRDLRLRKGSGPIKWNFPQGNALSYDFELGLVSTQDVCGYPCSF